MAVLSAHRVRHGSYCRVHRVPVTVYRTIAADCPWPYTDRLAMKAGKVKRSAGSHYATMTVPEICALGDSMPRRVAGYRIAVDAFLWLWITNPFLLDGTGAKVCRAWGFEPRQLITWVKGRLDVEDVGRKAGHAYQPSARFIAHVGMGHLTRGCTEHLILATRGKSKYLLKNKRTPNVFIAPRSRHSEKPQAAYDLIEALTPGPNLELFARVPRPNWTTYGNDPRLKETA